MKITANVVTIARIALVPVPSAMLLAGDRFWVWVAFVVASILGATDAVDGYLARRDGPTVLGALLDPFADKLFTAAFFLPIIYLGHSDAWLMAVIFARELLITALRSSMELHEARLQTSWLGKLKTVVQMGGLAVYVFIVWPPPGLGLYLHLTAIFGLVLVGVIYMVRSKPPPYWVVAGVPLWVLIFAISQVLAPIPTVFWLFVVMMALTWISGFDYLIGSWRTFRASGVTRADGVRVLWALVNGTLPILVLVYDRQQVILAMLGLGATLALGGIDNIVTAERKRAMRGGFVLITAAAVCWFVTVWLASRGIGMAVDDTAVLGVGYVLLSLVAVATTFWSYRDLFLSPSASRPLT